MDAAGGYRFARPGGNGLPIGSGAHMLIGGHGRSGGGIMQPIGGTQQHPDSSSDRTPHRKPNSVSNYKQLEVTLNSNIGIEFDLD